MKALVSICLFIFVISSTGCSKTDSENIRTSGIRAELTVTATGADVSNDSLVEARLYSGGSGIGGTLIEVSSGDTLTAYEGAVKYQMVKKADLFDIYYLATLPSGDVNTVYQVSFERDEGVSATESYTMLPDPFEITSSHNSPVLKETDLNVTWSPAGSGSLKLAYDFDCLTSTGGSVNTSGIQTVTDNGSAQIDIVDMLNEHMLDEPISTCDGYIDFKRSQSGTLDSNFGEGGSIQGIQRRRLELDIVSSI